MEVIGKLGIGPMSSEVIESAFRFAQVAKQPLMLISSRNQIDWEGGYVENWTTRQYADFAGTMRQKYPQAKIYLCRDHCGPGFKPGSNDNDKLDVYKTINDDIANGFDLIHVDFCHYSSDDKEILVASRQAVEHILREKPDMLIEMGTDENNGRNFRDLKDIEKQMQFFRDFCQPHFYVGQTGSLIQELGQQGHFRKEYIKKLHQLAEKYDLALKEHNADYLSPEEVIKRRGLIEAMNVAPQYGVLQTMLSLQKCALYGIDPEDFLEESYQSRRWSKWLRHSSPEDRYRCSVIAGHYHFAGANYKRIFDQLEKYEDFKETIISEMMKNFRMYLDNLQ